MEEYKEYKDSVLQGGSATHRGIALIISMEEDRKGGEADRGRLEMLARFLRFDPILIVRKNAEQLRSEIEKWAESPALKHHDSFLCFVNAHGSTDESGKQFIQDDSEHKEKVYVLEDIVGPFKRCKLLWDKPKLFFINACRGPYKLTTNRGTELRRDPAFKSNEKTVDLLRTRSDTFVMFSTDEGDESWRDELSGTNFADELCQSFFENSQEMHVHDIATDVNNRLSRIRPRRGGGGVQNAVIVSTLKKNVYWRRHNPNSENGKVFPPRLVAEHMLLLYDSKLDTREFRRDSKVDIVFFHGYEFENSMAVGYPAAMSSWMTRSQHGEGEVCWPVDWLPGSDGLGLPLRIFSVTYNGLQVTRKECNHERNLQSTAESLQHELFVLQTSLGLGQDRGLVFVGHGLGGLLIKSILDPSKCADAGKLQILKRELIGIAFYGVPCIPSALPQEHAGSSSFSVSGLEKGLQKENGVSALMSMDELRAALLNPEKLKDAHESFKEMRGKVKVFVEGQDTHGMKLGDHNHPGQFYCSHVNEMLIKTNHFDICKPRNRGDNSFVFLVNFIKRQHMYRSSGVYEGQAVQFGSSQKAFIVGQQQYFDDMKKRLLSADGKHILGITGDSVFGVYGMGGIGKTTLAKSLRDDEDVQQYFGSHVYFVCIKKDPNIIGLQGHLMYQICKEMPTTSCSNEDILRDKLQEQLRRLPKFLLFLDDVWNKAHVDRLLGEDFIHGLPSGSRCIITTRLKSELVKFKATLTVEVDFLSDEESRRLFCHHAFPGHTDLPEAIPDYLAQVVEEVINGCNNLPLTLVAIGEERRGRMNLETWQATRDKLRLAKNYANPYDQAIEIVKVSYDSLPDYYSDANLKDMYLDFAAFPEREEIEISMVMDLWRRQGLGEKAAVGYLEQLEDRCMLKLTGYWCYVHDIFRAMAIKLIEEGPVEEWKRLFAWGTSVTDRLPAKWMSTLGTQVARGGAPLSTHLSVCPGSFSSVYSTLMNCLGLQQRDRDARLLFRSEKLVISRTGLRHFHSLDCRLFSHLGQLRTLVLSANMSLESLPAEIGCLKMLERLDLSWSFALESLPGEIGQLPRLEKLNLAGCCTLASLPREIGSLGELTDLDLRSSGIVELPPEIGHLTKLRRLNIKDADKLRSLPPEIGQLRALKTLDAALTHIDKIPKEIGQLVNLKNLSFEGCGRVEELPCELAGLKNLVSLNCINSINLKVVPPDLDRLVTQGKLRFFNLYNTGVDRRGLPPGLRGLPMPFSGATDESDDIGQGASDGEASTSGTVLDQPAASKQKFYLSLFASGTKEDRRAAFGLARMVQLAQMETFNSTRMKMAIRMIYTMANDHSTRHTVIKNGGLPVLLRCLQEGDPDCAQYAASALCNICVSGTTINDLVDANGLTIITSCMNKRGAGGRGAKQALDWILQYRNDCIPQVIDLLGHTGGPGCPCGFCWYTRH